MSEDLGPGDKVECVDVKPRAVSSPAVVKLLTLNAHYVIREIVRDGKRKGVHLAEIRTPNDVGYFADRFRLISRRGDFLEILKKLKTPIKGLKPDTDEGQKIKTPEKTDA